MNSAIIPAPMEKFTTATVITRGKGSLGLKLPMLIAYRLGVNVGDTVEYYIDGNDLILRFPKPIVEGAEKPLF